jgi:site-specific recombinase XerD
MDLQRAINDYIVWHEVNRHSPKTITWYRWNLGAFERWLRANNRSTLLADLSVTDARAFLQSETQREIKCPDHPTGIARPGKLSDRTLHCYARAIRALFRWLVEEEYLDKNPMQKLKPPKLEQRMKQILTPEEIQHLLDGTNPNTFFGARMYAMIALLYDSGLRASELLGVNLSDIQWTEYQVRVMGKGRKERLVPFGPAVHKALRRYITLRESFVRDETQTLFITHDGRRLVPNALTLAVKRLGKKVGVPRAHPHLFRHSAAVAAVMNGANQFELKRILGHTQLGTTDGYMDYAKQHLAQRHRTFSPMAKISERRASAVRGETKRRQRG